MPEKKIGKITHFFDKISVAVVSLSAGLSVGDKIRIEAAEPFEQVVSSMQVEHKPIKKAKAGDDVGLKTTNPCKEGDIVVKLAA
ncbi:MAG: translation elongation factor-like protein [Nanoarchaeota archaeon]